MRLTMYEDFDRTLSPQHPAAHGVLRMILELNGEEILRADPVCSSTWVSEQAIDFYFSMLASSTVELKS
jgi:hypothetical protein